MVKKEGELTDRVASIVLAGGQGTRLFPLTQSRCKPAVSFGGRYRLIDIPISNSLNSKIRRIFVLSQYFAADLNQHILSTYHLDLFQSGEIKLLTPEETEHNKSWFKGTADAVRQCINHLRQAPVDYFLILSGDQLYNMDYIEMLEFAKKTDADLVIATLPVKEAEAKRMGIMKVDSSMKITDFYEKPSTQEALQPLQLKEDFLKKHKIASDSPHYLGSMGIYIFKREALFSLLTEYQDEDFGKHLIPVEIKKGRTYSFLFNSYWEDIGTVESFYLANLALAARQNCLDVYDENHPIYTRAFNLPSPIIKNSRIVNSLISQGAIIEADEVSNSVVGIRAHIKKRSVIRDSIIMGNLNFEPPFSKTPKSIKHFSIGEDCTIQKTIIDEHTSIGNHVKLINKNHLKNLDGDGIYIRDGIIIVTTGTHVPDGFIL